MQGINHRGHFVLAGLIGGFIGVLVAASWSSPAATSEVSPQSEGAVSLSGHQAELAKTNTGNPDLRKVQEALWAMQKVEAEYYPGRNASLSTAGASDVGNPDLHNLQEALRAKQRVEAEYYPGRNASLSTAGASDVGSPDLRKLQDALRAKQRVEAEYYPGY